MQMQKLRHHLTVDHIFALGCRCYTAILPLLQETEYSEILSDIHISTNIF